MNAKETKTERIDVRTTVAAKQLLQQAAATSHKSVSEFLLENGLQAAQTTLADRRLFLLDDDRWEEFQAILDRPVQSKPQLKKLLSEPGIFD
jgi:uncharacterized protein (DUF1778 family)